MLTDCLPAFRWSARCTLLCACALSSGPVPAQRPVLIKDLDPAPRDGGAKPDDLTLAGTTLFFTAYTAATGRELWASPGGTGRPYLVKDLQPGPADAAIEAPQAMGGKLYFGFGKSLWVSDGTSAGTTAVIALGSGIAAIHTLGSRILVVGGSLWVSDGTAAGTSRLPGTWWAYNGHVVGTRLYFEDHRPRPPVLWWTDGSAAGTAQVPGVADVRILGSLRGRVVFTAQTTGRTLFVSDGSVAGTVPIGSFVATHGVEFGGRFHFLESSPTTGEYTLHVTDGTAAGTRLVRKLTGVRTPVGFVPAGTNLFIATWSGLWRTDGTTTGTTQVVGSIEPRVMPRALGTQVLFAAADAAGRWEPWISDGTTIGTRRLADVNRGRGSSNPRSFTAVPGGEVAFVADDGRIGAELWATDGSERNTRLVGDLDPTPTSTRSSDATLTAGHGGLALIQDAVFPGRLWRTDGTAAGTFELPVERTAGPLSVAGHGADFLCGGEGGVPSARLLVRSDGTAAGTRVIRAFTSGWAPQHLTRLGRHVYFFGGDPGAGVGLWRTDGTSAGTSFVAPMGLHRIFAWRGALYLVAYVNASWQLLRSDGTRIGTVPLAPGVTAWLDTRFFPDPDFLYFNATGDELYRTDGTAAGTQRVRNGVQAHGIARMGGRLYFLGADLVTSQQGLFRTDGTSTGTVMVRPVVFPWGPRLTAADDKLFFYGLTPGTGVELWCSDGSSAGTRLVRDIRPGPGGSIPISSATPAAMVAVGPFVYFTADDGVHGCELWRSDGTSAGTRLVDDLWPGPGGSLPKDLVLNAGSLLFSADDGYHGREPFRLELPAHAVDLGPGCGIAVPALRATGPRLGQSMQVEVTDAPRTPGTAGILLFGALPRRPSLHGGACTVYVDLGAPSIPWLFRPSNGAWSSTVPVPANPALHGLDIVAQAAVGPSGQAPFGLDLSGGLLLALRR